MATEHKSITDPELHEPKGVAAATSGQVYIANGATSGAWSKVTEGAVSGLGTGTTGQVVTSNGTGGFTFLSMPHGRISFINIATPYVLTYPSTYTKVAPTTIASGSSTEFTEGTNSRLTFIGTTSRHFHIAATISASQASGSARDIRFALSKNGIILPTSETIQTTTTGNKVSTALHADTMMTNGDYIELIARNDGASGDITLYTFYLFAMGMYEG